MIQNVCLVTMQSFNERVWTPETQDKALKSMVSCISCTCDFLTQNLSKKVRFIQESLQYFCFLCRIYCFLRRMFNIFWIAMKLRKEHSSLRECPERSREECSFIGPIAIQRMLNILLEKALWSSLSKIWWKCAVVWGKQILDKILFT